MDKPVDLSVSQRQGVSLAKGTPISTTNTSHASTRRPESKGLQLNLGKEGKEMINLSSDSDSDEDYEEVNEIV